MSPWKKLWQETKSLERAALLVSIVALTITSGWSLSGQRASENLPPLFEEVPAVVSQKAATSPGAVKTDAGTITIHVAGAVKRPGVFNLPGNARVADAIKAAGGARDGADTNALNLAAFIEDGSQVRVPTRGQTLVSAQTRDATGTEIGNQSASRQSFTRPVNVPKNSINVNTASATEIEILPGIGPALAARIIAHRTEEGRFNSIDDLDAVKGIGPAKLEKMKPFVTF